jgi:hypothetical protein
MEEELGNRDNNPNNPVVILRFAILTSSSDRGRLALDGGCQFIIQRKVSARTILFGTVIVKL